MKIAEEYARELRVLIHDEACRMDDIVDALNAFADERVNEWKIKMDDNLDLLVGERLLEIRADALEEAAKVATSINLEVHPNCDQKIAFCIRSLKDAK